LTEIKAIQIPDKPKTKEIKEENIKHIHSKLKRLIDNFSEYRLHQIFKELVKLEREYRKKIK